MRKRWISMIRECFIDLMEKFISIYFGFSYIQYNTITFVELQIYLYRSIFSIQFEKKMYI